MSWAHALVLVVRIRTVIYRRKSGRKYNKRKVKTV